MSTSPRFGTIPGKTPDVLENVSPVKLMGPFPVATTLDPTCFSVTVKAWAGWTKKTATAVNIKEQRIAAKISVFIVISRFGIDARDYCRSKLATGGKSQ